MNTPSPTPESTKLQGWLYQAAILTCILLTICLLGINWEIYSQLQTPVGGPPTEGMEESGDYSKLMPADRISGIQLLTWPKESQRFTTKERWRGQSGIDVVEMPESAWPDWIAELRSQGWEIRPGDNGLELGFTVSRTGVEVQIRSGRIPGPAPKRVIVAMVIQH